MSQTVKTVAASESKVLAAALKWEHDAFGLLDFSVVAKLLLETLPPGDSGYEYDGIKK